MPNPVHVCSGCGRVWQCAVESCNSPHLGYCFSCRIMPPSADAVRRVSITPPPPSEPFDDDYVEQDEWEEGDVEHDDEDDFDNHNSSKTRRQQRTANDGAKNAKEFADKLSKVRWTFKQGKRA